MLHLGGNESLLFKHGADLLKNLITTPFHIIIRPHPQSLIREVEAQNIASLKKQFQSPHIEWDIGTPNVIAFSKADLMISDFSSVIFDFVCLEGKPVLTLDFTFDSAGYDLADIYNENNINEFWTFKALNQIGGKISQSDFPQIKSIIESALNSSANKDALNNIKSTLWRFPHKGGLNSALELLKIRQFLIESTLDNALLAQRDNLQRAIATLTQQSQKDKYAI